MVENVNGIHVNNASVAAKSIDPPPFVESALENLSEALVV